MAKQTKAKGKASENNNIMYLFAYFLTFISGIIVFLISPTDKRLKLHAIQAIILGVVIVIIAIIGDIIVGVIIASSLASYGGYYPYAYHPAAFGAAGLIGGVFSLIEFVIWLYGMYVGFQAYNGKDMTIPMVTDMATKFSK